MRGQGLSLVINLVLAASVIAPVIEEVFFRGLLLRSAVSSLNRHAPADSGALTNPIIGSRMRTKAIAASASMFAALHLSEVTSLTSAVVLVNTLVLVGATNAALVLTTRRLGSAVVTHVVCNATPPLSCSGSG